MGGVCTYWSQFPGATPSHSSCARCTCIHVLVNVLYICSKINKKYCVGIDANHVYKRKSQDWNQTYIQHLLWSDFLSLSADIRAYSMEPLYSPLNDNLTASCYGTPFCRPNAAVKTPATSKGPLFFGPHTSHLLCLMCHWLLLVYVVNVFLWQQPNRKKLGRIRILVAMRNVKCVMVCCIFHKTQPRAMDNVRQHFWRE